MPRHVIAAVVLSLAALAFLFLGRQSCTEPSTRSGLNDTNSGFSDRWEAPAKVLEGKSREDRIALEDESRNPNSAQGGRDLDDRIVLDSEQEILDAFRGRRPSSTVESTGVVYRLLADDREGSRHQRFLLRLSSGHSLLISHNIDLAERVPVDVGECIHFRGRYEWNEQGGVVHWTHRDPQGRREGGWILHQGRRYD